MGQCPLYISLIMEGTHMDGLSTTDTHSIKLHKTLANLQRASHA